MMRLAVDKSRGLVLVSRHFCSKTAANPKPNAQQTAQTLQLEDVAKMYASNSLLTFHPEERLFSEEAYWKVRFVDNVSKRHSRYQEQFEKLPTFSEVNRKFVELVALKQELRQLNAVKPKHGKKPDFQRKKALKNRLLELRSDLLAQWLALPVEIEQDVQTEAQIVKQFDYAPLLLDREATHLSVNDPEFRPDVAPGAVYFSQALAEFDMKLKTFVCDRFRKSQFLQMSPPDTLRLPVYLSTLDDTFPAPETVDLVANLTLNNQALSGENQLLENSFVLAGAGSPQTLIGLFAKQLIKRKYFPKTVFSQGELYAYFPNYKAPQQKSSLAFVMMGHSQAECAQLFEQTAEFLQTAIFQPLRLPFTCLNASSQRLSGAESKRLEFLSPLEGGVIQPDKNSSPPVLLAQVAMHRDYFSRRCEIFASSSDATDTYRTLHFPFMASGILDLEAILKALTTRFCVKRLAELLKS